jgi:hypothetical protein
VQSFRADRFLAGETDPVAAFLHAPQRALDPPSELGFVIYQRHGEIALSGELGLIQSIGGLLDGNIGAFVGSCGNGSQLRF